jgi:hypothetical protein
LALQHPSLRALLPKGSQDAKEGPSATRTLEKVGRAVAQQKQVVRKAQERLHKLHAAIEQATRSLEVAQGRLESLREDWREWLTASQQEVGGSPGPDEDGDCLSQASGTSAFSDVDNAGPPRAAIAAAPAA